MAEEVLFQRKVAGISLEVLSEGGNARACVTYPYPDLRFERGGFPVVALVMRELGSLLARRDGLRALFVAELFPCPSEEAPPQEPLDLDPLSEWLGEQRTGLVGLIEPTQGYWMSVNEGLRGLDELGRQLEDASAEASRVRLLVLQSETRSASGWDVSHADGITTLGRWRLELDDEPKPIDPEDLQPTIDLLAELASILALKLANGAAHLLAPPSGTKAN